MPEQQTITPPAVDTVHRYAGALREGDRVKAGADVWTLASNPRLAPDHAAVVLLVFTNGRAERVHADELVRLLVS